MFFDKLKLLCEEKGISVYKACTDIGLNRSAVNKWKSGGLPRGSVVAKFAEYFGVSADYLLGNEKSAQAVGEDAETSDEDKRLQAINEKIALLSEEKRAALEDIINFLLEK